MPIYEFFCPDCNTLYTFFSRRINPSASPNCPQCGRANIQRKISKFILSSGRPERTESEPQLDFDDKKLERAFGMLADDVTRLNEDDPRQAAQAMRQFYRNAGLEMGDGMEEAFARLARGEDVDQIEAELGAALSENEDAAFKEIKKSRQTGLSGPKKDAKLYEL